MRTTLTLDPDVARLLEDAVHRERRPLKQVVNDALRRGLATPGPRRGPYRVKVHHSALRPGLDLTGFNELADELEDEAILQGARHRRS
ncbi:MAG: antitoxin [Candidatus Dormibacteraeota bacterium]|nr:antitoxin [Candidatus Dormibacteraeota bacterium]